MLNNKELIKANLMGTRKDKPQANVDFVSQEVIKKVNGNWAKKSVVYMPKGSSLTRLNNIKKEGSEASIIDGNYEDAVKLSEEMAKKNGWVVIQDTAWEGHEEIPT